MVFRRMVLAVIPMMLGSLFLYFVLEHTFKDSLAAFSIMLSFYFLFFGLLKLIPAVWEDIVLIFGVLICLFILLVLKIFVPDKKEVVSDKKGAVK